MECKMVKDSGRIASEFFSVPRGDGKNETFIICKIVQWREALYNCAEWLFSYFFCTHNHLIKHQTKAQKWALIMRDSLIRLQVLSSSGKLRCSYINYTTYYTFSLLQWITKNFCKTFFFNYSHIFRDEHTIDHFIDFTHYITFKKNW